LSSNYQSFDNYEDYEDLFDPMQNDRRARRKRNPKPVHEPKKSQEEILDELTDDMAGLEGSFETTYQPSQYEAEWLLSSLRPFFDQMLITDVLALVKGGKEASVYRCQAHESTGKEFLAAKVYRPRKFRNLRNDKMYREGRQILTGQGRAVKNNEHRIMRAIGKKSAFGVQVEHTSWLMYEFTTMKNLYEQGATVPTPIAAGENAILMEYYGDEAMPAPTLNEVRLESDDVQPVFDEAMRNIELMLSEGVVHGDLSPYNMLYWNGQLVVIDFPQVVDPEANNNAYFILQRDIERTCKYFARQGLECDAGQIADRLWKRYVSSTPADLARLYLDE
jgi:RIO kinase 1